MYLFSRSWNMGTSHNFAKRRQLFARPKVYTDSFMHIHLSPPVASTFLLLPGVCSSGEEIWNVTRTQPRPDSNHQQMGAAGAERANESSLQEGLCPTQAVHWSQTWVGKMRLPANSSPHFSHCCNLSQASIFSNYFQALWEVAEGILEPSSREGRHRGDTSSASGHAQNTTCKWIASIQ